jgi:hypothetical protein
MEANPPAAGSAADDAPAAAAAEEPARQLQAEQRQEEIDSPREQFVELARDPYAEVMDSEVVGATNGDADAQQPIPAAAEIARAAVSEMEPEPAEPRPAPPSPRPGSVDAPPAETPPQPAAQLTGDAPVQTDVQTDDKLAADPPPTAAVPEGAAAELPPATTPPRRVLPPGGTPGKRPGGSFNTARLENLAEQILQEVRRGNEQFQVDFSVSKLLAGIVQILSLAAVFFAYLNKDKPGSLEPTLLAAVFLQTLTIALLIMGKQK